MAVQVKPKRRQVSIDQLDVRPLDLDEYHRMIEIGLFDEDERVELIEGVLHRMSPKGPPHAACLERLDNLLSEKLTNRARIRTQDPITVPSSQSEPEPDLIVFVDREGGYLDHHPFPENVLLLVEVADTSLEVDRGVKKQIYAAAGIEDYWIVNLVDNQVEVYREPMVLEDGTATYRRRTLYRAGDTVTLLHFPDCEVDVAALLP